MTYHNSFNQYYESVCKDMGSNLKAGLVKSLKFKIQSFHNSSYITYFLSKETLICALYMATYCTLNTTLLDISSPRVKL